MGYDQCVSPSVGPGRPDNSTLENKSRCSAKCLSPRALQSEQKQKRPYTKFFDEEPVRHGGMNLAVAQSASIPERIESPPTAVARQEAVQWTRTEPTIGDMKFESAFSAEDASPVLRETATLVFDVERRDTAAISQGSDESSEISSHASKDPAASSQSHKSSFGASSSGSSDTLVESVSENEVTSKLIATSKHVNPAYAALMALDPAIVGIGDKDSFVPVVVKSQDEFRTLLYIAYMRSLLDSPDPAPVSADTKPIVDAAGDIGVDNPVNRLRSATLKDAEPGNVLSSVAVCNEDSEIQQAGSGIGGPPEKDVSINAGPDEDSKLRSLSFTQPSLELEVESAAVVDIIKCDHTSARYEVPLETGVTSAGILNLTDIEEAAVKPKIELPKTSKSVGKSNPRQMGSRKKGLDLFNAGRILQAAAKELYREAVLETSTAGVFCSNNAESERTVVELPKDALRIEPGKPTITETRIPSPMMTLPKTTGNVNASKMSLTGDVKVEILDKPVKAPEVSSAKVLNEAVDAIMVAEHTIPKGSCGVVSDSNLLAEADAPLAPVSESAKAIINTPRPFSNINAPQSASSGCKAPVPHGKPRMVPATASATGGKLPAAEHEAGFGRFQAGMGSSRWATSKPTQQIVRKQEAAASPAKKPLICGPGLGNSKLVVSEANAEVPPKYGNFYAKALGRGYGGPGSGSGGSRRGGGGRR